MSARPVSAALCAVVALFAAGCGDADGPSVPDARRAGPPPGTAPAAASFARACAEEARRPGWQVDPLCPTLMPVGGFERPRQYGVRPCARLLNLEPRGFADRPGAVFHVLLGTRCARWDLGTAGGTWPARAFTGPQRRAGEDLRLAGDLRLLRRATARTLLAVAASGQRWIRRW